MSTLTPDERQLLWDIADVLIPATATMPSLRDADPAGEWLDRACSARGDQRPALQQALHTLAGTADLATALRGLHGNDRGIFDALATYVAGAYYMIPRVRELLGYPGQVRNAPPLDQAAEELSDEIFEAAMAYEGSYRPVPA